MQSHVQEKSIVAKQEQFKRKLYNPLIAERISISTNIINEIVYQLAKVEFPKDKEDFKRGFDFNETREDQIHFNLPKLKFDPEGKKLLAFFQIPESEYEMGSPLNLHEDFVFQKLLPMIKQKFNELVISESDIIKKYQIESKSILENLAVDTIRTRASEAQEILMPKDATEISPNFMIGQTIDFLYQLEAQTSAYIYGGKALLYLNFENALTNLTEMLHSPELYKNEKLVQKLRSLKEGLELFKLYHRAESVIKNTKFFNNIEELLKSYEISSSLCNVIEDSLLRLSDVKLGPNAKCEISTGYDKSRLVLKLEDIDQENANKLVQYLRNQGDETALEGRGYRKHGGVIPTAECAMVSREKSLRVVHANPPEKLIEKHFIETDGKFFYDKMLPQLRYEITSTLNADKETLEKYQKASEKLFPKKTETVKEKVVGNANLFPMQPTQGQTQQQNSVVDNKMDLDEEVRFTFNG